MFRIGKLTLTLGVLVGFVVGVLFGNHLRMPSADAQEPAKATAGHRYQLQTFGTNTHFGAYIIDQQTGQVFYIDQNNKPMPLGTVGK